MMPYLGLGTPTLKDGPVHGETLLLGQEATRGLPILGPTPGRHLLPPTPDRHLLVPTLDRHLLAPTLDRHLLAPTLDRHLLAPTLALQHLLIPDPMPQEPTPDNQVGLRPTLVPAPLTSLLDH
ncbi:hypothetical protein QTO34_019906 [Cnephaeus nilssonii]|uniref:Uncharacterized protein n=1 Tax=Cnephaeus nilssonii TaxID=3371016 RepID=A0AA40HXI0_CNENI|nr:hypothetical protein QTO34_019906 [Eptesicus nilssonii]